MTLLPVPDSTAGVAVLGSVVMISYGVSNGYQYTALDAATLGPYPLFAPALSSLASRDARIYADLERDEASSLPTGNSVRWQRPIAVVEGVVDIEPDTPKSAAAWYVAAAPVAPAAPTGLAADLNGDRVTVRWSTGAGDLRPLVAPPSAGGTAATSHVISVSLTPDGPAARASTRPRTTPATPSVRRPGPRARASRERQRHQRTVGGTARGGTALGARLPDCDDRRREWE